MTIRVRKHGRTDFPVPRRTGSVVSETLFGAVAMHDFDTISGAAQVLADFLGDHDGAVLASGTTERDSQVALAFVDVVRQQIDQQIRDARNELLRLRK